MFWTAERVDCGFCPVTTPALTTMWTLDGAPVENIPALSRMASPGIMGNEEKYEAAVTSAKED